MICLFCNTEIKPDEKKYFFGLDRPYINVFIHRTCYDEIIKDQEKMDMFLKVLLSIFNNKNKHNIRK